MNRLDHPLKIINEHTDVLRSALNVAKRKKYADGGDVQDDPSVKLMHTQEGNFPYYIFNNPAPERATPSAETATDPYGAVGASGASADKNVGQGLANIASGIVHTPQRFIEANRPTGIATEDNPTGGVTEEGAGEAFNIAGALAGTGASFMPTRALGAAGSRMIQPAAEAAVADPFYSQVGRTLEAAPQNKASPDQWMGWLKNQPGVKQEELEWMGLPDFLKQQNGPVTKDALQDFVKNNQVELNTVKKSDVPEETGRFIAQTDRLGNLKTFNSKEEADAWAQQARATGNQEFNSLQIVPEVEKQPSTKFGQYIKNKGENYGETLLTMPPKFEGGVGLTMNDIAKRLGYSGWHSSLTPEQVANVERAFSSQKMGPTDFNNRMEAIKDEISNLSRYDPRRRELAQERDALQAEHDATAQDQFKSPHWNEPGVLAHALHSDRVINGKKYLQIHEIQSDLHQKGQAQGYQGQGNKIEPPPFDDWLKNQTWYVHRGSGPEAEAKWHRLYDEWVGRNATTTGVVPDAPFKNTWHDLALKRMVKYAADNDYAGLLIDRGETVADRYDLSKQVNSLLYKKNADGTFRLSAQAQGRGHLLGESLTENQLADHVGKDVAKKIANGEGKDQNLGSGSGTSQIDMWKNLSGEGLKVGGEFHKKLYNEKIPQALNKIGKKYGAKVEEIPVKNDNAPEDVVNYWAAREPNHPLVLKNRTPTTKLDFTPELKAQATGQGFPLFSKGGRVDDYTRRFRNAIKIMKKA